MQHDTQNNYDTKRVWEQLLRSGKLGMPAAIAILTSWTVTIVHPVHAQYSPSMITGNPLPIPVLPNLNTPVMPGNSSPVGIIPGSLSAVNGVSRYMVFVPGSDEGLLMQVRQLEPAAFRRIYNGQSVVQSGVFLSQSNAEQQANWLRSLGMNAQIAQIAGGQVASSSVTSFGGEQTGITSVPGVFDGSSGMTFTAPSLPTASSPTTISAALPQNYSPGYPTQTQPSAVTTQPNFSGYYFVVIPGRGDNLNAIANRIQQLGAQPGTFFPRTQPIGPHVAMGPFPDRGAADQWNRYLRGYGLDARVYYER